jgi:hypothetical protein
MCPLPFHEASSRFIHAQIFTHGDFRQRTTEHFLHCPLSVGSSRCHRWNTLEVSLRQTFATSFSRLHERHPERCMGEHKMRVSSPPLQVGQELWGLLAVAQVRRARADTPCRTVKFTRSIKAVFNRPERPNHGPATLRAASVPRRITCETFTS